MTFGCALARTSQSKAEVRSPPPYLKHKITLYQTSVAESVNVVTEVRIPRHLAP
ncbi:hypothetical protein RR48_05244 [Papilio machaon]|uniref:Uncharacterized protein n=1 Tax=Papilio machaon TaxID=76193 RepID=A0A0N0PCK7_PAPMA|nr:hypothetical protein RR48_05244 [Papilio machaon]